MIPSNDYEEVIKILILEVRVWETKLCDNVTEK
jgi:hypothetical protein